MKVVFVSFSLSYKQRFFLISSYISTLVLTYSRLKKGRATFFRPEAIVASFLHLMVLSFRVIFNHTSKRQIVVLHFRIPSRLNQVPSSDFGLNCIAYKMLFFVKIHLKMQLKKYFLIFKTMFTYQSYLK